MRLSCMLTSLRRGNHEEEKKLVGLQGSEIVQRLMDLHGSGQPLTTKERAAIILDKRRQGWSYAKIAEILDVTKETCCAIANDAMRKNSFEMAEDADMVRAMELERLD